MEEYIAPVPSVIFHYMMSFRLDPKIERDQGKASDPTGPFQSKNLSFYSSTTYRMTWVNKDKPSGTRKHANANMQYATKSLFEGQ